MTAVVTVLQLVAIGAGGWFLAMQAIPRVFVRAGRLLGRRMQLTPIMAKRLARFRRIRRGRRAFVVIVTCFVISLFAEFFVNHNALVISFDGRLAFPAAAEWADTWLPFAGFSAYNRASDFGLVGDAPIDYRAYARYCADPELLRVKAQARAEEHARLIAQMGAEPARPAPVEKPPPFDLPAPAAPGPDASQEERDAYEDARADWEDARDVHDDLLDAYEDCVADLRDWENYQLDLKVAAGIAQEIEGFARAYDAFGAGKAWVILPLYPYGPRDPRLDLPGHPPHGPSWWPHLKVWFTGAAAPEGSETGAEAALPPVGSHPLGTTDNGLDVLPQLVYGFRIAMVFALVVAACGYAVGVIVGGIMGYFGGWTDILVQRFIEIYSSIPFLYTIMILASIVQPGLLVLALMLIVLRSWIGITYYVRGEFYREKAKDYVQSAIGTGVSDWKVMTGHILPNALVPVVTFAPFAIVSYILTLVSLDYLGFGLPPGTPSWGYLLSQGSQYLRSYPHLILIPSVALAATLFCVVVIGEAVREAFDPKVFSRLR